MSCDCANLPPRLDHSGPSDGTNWFFSFLIVCSQSFVACPLHFGQCDFFFCLLWLAPLFLWLKPVSILSRWIRPVEPCDNFYQYACAVWRTKNPLPNDQARWSRFSELSERKRLVPHKIAEELRDPHSNTLQTTRRLAIFTPPVWMKPGLRRKG